MICPIVDSIINPIIPFDNVPPTWVKPNLLAWWDARHLSPFNPPVDNTWYDCSGHGRNMTMANLAYAPLSTLSAANGFEVDGVDDYGVIADSAATRLTTGGTLAAWIYPKSLGEVAGHIFAKGVDDYTLILLSSGGVTLRGYAGTTNTQASGGAITLSKWSHVAFTFNSTGRCLYVNGINATATGGAETALPPDTAGVVTIGNISGGTTRTFNGYIDRLAIFNRALMANEVKQLFQGSKRRYGV